MPNKDNKRTLDGLEASLRSHNKADDHKSGLVHSKEALKKVGVVVINSARGIIDAVNATLHALMGAVHVVKVVTYDVPTYALSTDEISSEKAWDILKDDVNASKDYIHEVYHGVGDMASDAVKIVEHGTRAAYHAGMATGAALVFAYDTTKATAKAASSAANSVHEKIASKVGTAIPMMMI